MVLSNATLSVSCAWNYSTKFQVLIGCSYTSPLFVSKDTAGIGFMLQAKACRDISQLDACHQPIRLVLILLQLIYLQLADAMELMLLSVLGPIVKCQWNLSETEEAIITSVSVYSNNCT